MDPDAFAQADRAWVHDLDPIAFEIFGVAIRWYGLSYIAGFALAGLAMALLARRRLTPLRPPEVVDLLFFVLLGVLIGGRFGYVLFYRPALLADFGGGFPFWGALRINEGGMASHGGMIGVVLAAIFFAYSRRVSPLHLCDLLAFAAPLGLLLGRLANFINGELLGRIVARPGEPGPSWSVRFPQELMTGHRPPLNDEQMERLGRLLETVAQPGDGVAESVRRLITRIQHGATDLERQLAPLLSARHPSQLYQAFAEGIVLLAALALVWARPRRPGVVTAWFLMVYGALRIVTEFFRLPDDHLAVQRIAGLTRGQWLSALMIVAGVALLLFIRRRAPAALYGGLLTGPTEPARAEAEAREAALQRDAGAQKKSGAGDDAAF